MNHHICPCQLSQQLVKAKPDITVDFKVRRAFALETARGHTDFPHMQRRFLEFICFNVKRCPALLCVDMVHLAFSIFFIFTAGQSWGFIS